MEKKDKIICPHCKGNGFVRVPYQLAKEEETPEVEETPDEEKAQ